MAITFAAAKVFHASFDRTALTTAQQYLSLRGLTQSAAVNERQLLYHGLSQWAHAMLRRRDRRER